MYVHVSHHHMFILRALCVSDLTFRHLHFFLLSTDNMPERNGYSVNTKRSEESEDTDYLIENNAGKVIALKGFLY